MRLILYYGVLTGANLVDVDESDRTDDREQPGWHQEDEELWFGMALLTSEGTTNDPDDDGGPLFLEDIPETIFADREAIEIEVAEAWAQQPTILRTGQRELGWRVMVLST